MPQNQITIKKQLFRFVLRICAALLLCGAAWAAAPVSAQVIGEVYTTDIGALIDEQPIRSYNFQDRTYVVAEDLRGYGFHVVWDADARTLAISRDTDPYSTRVSLLPSEINIKKADIPYLQKLYDVYDTDIKTYLDGQEIPACNINGQTLIPFAQLADAGGAVSYDDTVRLARLDFFCQQLSNALAGQENQQSLTLSDGVTYEGVAADGQPNGLGMIRDQSRMTEFPGTISDMLTVAQFTGGEIDGPYFSRGTKESTIGSYQGQYDVFEFGIKDRGGTEDLKGLYHSYSNMYFTPSYYDSYLSADGTSGFTRRATGDPAYLFGFQVTEYHTILDGDTDIAALGAAPVFDRFGSNEYSALSVIDTDGNLYTAPHASEYYQNAVYRRRNVQTGNYNENWVLARDNKLYIIRDDNEANDVCVAENAVAANFKNYLDTAGTLWEDAQDGNGYFKVADNVKQFDGQNYVAFLKEDGTVWTYRSKNEPGTAWNDGLDRSTPVQRASGARFVSTEGDLVLYIAEDGGLWGFGGSYAGELGRLDPWDYDTYDYDKVLSSAPVKLGEDFVSVKAGQTCLGLKADGTLWAWGLNDYGQIVQGGEENILTPTKIADNVRDYAASNGAVYIIKTDGTLWHWGRAWYFANRSTYGQENTFLPLTQTTQVYQPLTYDMGA